MPLGQFLGHSDQKAVDLDNDDYLYEDDNEDGNNQGNAVLAKDFNLDLYQKRDCRSSEDQSALEREFKQFNQNSFYG